AARLAQRQGHFFPPRSSASQFAALEPLQPDEDAVTVDLTLTPEAQVAARLAQRQGHFFPPRSSASQFAALEPLQPDED
ncbi:hypothetical protein CNY89_29310, partial [Amaricoccus sp. HAR-UPW-R2A-40]